LFNSKSVFRTDVAEAGRHARPVRPRPPVLLLHF
jgi:hypothetical protein